MLFTVSIHLFICSPSSLLTSSSGPFPGDRHLNAIYLRLLLTAIGLRKHSENGFSSAPEVLAFKLIVLIYEIIDIQHCMQYLVLQNYSLFAHNIRNSCRSLCNFQSLSTCLSAPSYNFRLSISSSASFLRHIIFTLSPA